MWVLPDVFAIVARCYLTASCALHLVMVVRSFSVRRSSTVALKEAFNDLVLTVFLGALVRAEFTSKKANKMTLRVVGSATGRSVTRWICY